MHTTYFLSATKWGAVRATGFPWHLDTVLYKRGEERDGGEGENATVQYIPDGSGKQRTLQSGPGFWSSKPRTPWISRLVHRSRQKQLTRHTRSSTRR
jgi:hypothetical protein